MIIDMKDTASASVAIARVKKGRPYRCFLNGDEIRQVFFVDTDAGIIKTYDVWRDGKARSTAEVLSILSIDPNCIDRMVAQGRDVCGPDRGAVYETLRGLVTVE